MKQWRSVNAEDEDMNLESGVLLTLKMKTWILKQWRSVNSEDEDTNLESGVLLTLKMKTWTID